MKDHFAEWAEGAQATIPWAAAVNTDLPCTLTLPMTYSELCVHQLIRIMWCMRPG
jgi:hypothetical protein